MSTPEGFRIIHFYADNVLRLKVVEIEPPSDVVELTGGNRDGKSSVLRAIMMTLMGASAAPSETVINDEHEGSERAECRIDLGADGVVRYSVTRVWTRSGTYLDIRTPEGMAPHRKQGFLSAIIGKLALDPFAFFRMDARQQADVIRQIAELDTSALDSERERVFEERRDLGRDLARMKAGLVEPPPCPGAEIDIRPLLCEIERATEADRAAWRRASAIKSGRDAVLRAEQSLAEANAKLEIARRRVADAEAGLANARLELEAAQSEPEVVVPDVTELRKRVGEAERHNLEIAQWSMNAERYAARKAEIAATERKIEGLTQRLEQISEDRRALIAACKMPVDGLGLDDEGALTWQGRPLANCSRGEAIALSMKVAAAMSPTLRVILIEDASLMDDETEAQVREFARQHGYQLWLEKVRGASGTAIRLHEGWIEGEEGRAPRRSRGKPSEGDQA